MTRLFKHLLLLSLAFYASYYGVGDGFAGRTMANGQPMNPEALTCASWHYPLGAVLEVRHGGRMVKVVCADRGGLHQIDLSAGAFRRLAPLSRGIIKVEIRRIK